MTAIQITDRCQYLTQLTGDGGLTSTRITGQDDMHRHLLLLAQAAFSTLHAVLHSISNLADGSLHLVHADVLVEILQDILH